MSLGGLGLLTFGAPWVLAGLLILPAIWWLLRLMPPRAERISFPSLILLKDLAASEKTPAHTPLWLVILRSLVAVAAILALADPVLKPARPVAAAKGERVLVVVDNGWAAASRWESRIAVVNELAADATDDMDVLYLSATAEPNEPLEPLTPKDFLKRFASLVPQAFPADRRQIAGKLADTFKGQEGQFHVVWLSDGLKDEGANSLANTLSRLAKPGAFEFFSDPKGEGPLGLSMPRITSEAGLTVRVQKAEAEARRGSIAAETAKGERLAVQPFHIPAHASSADITITLPLEVRNQVARLKIEGENSAAGVFLLDGRAQRRKVGIFSNEDVEEAQPLLSPTHYLQKALAPYADLAVPRTGNINEAIADFQSRQMSVIILSDVGKLHGAAAEGLLNFVERGGMLIRFAGPRLEQGGDDLLPVALREGGRALGGAMTWSKPQKLARFEPGSLFQGLSIPADITVSRQVLADPARLSEASKVWARLSDGTPLVTVAPRGHGQIVLFHVTANTDWSNLPLSGLFVDMLRKLVDASPLQLAHDAPKGGAQSEQNTASKAEALGATEQFLKPWRVLDGFGELQEPGAQAQSIDVTQLKDVRAKRETPAGLYGPKDAFRAVNILGGDQPLLALERPGAARMRAQNSGTTLAIAPWLFLLGLCFFLADTFLTAFLLKGRRLGRWRNAAALFVVALLGAGVLGASSIHEARADTPVVKGSDKKALGDADAFALKASLETHLAYVITGDAETDRVSQAGLEGLSKVLTLRTAVEPAEPMAINPLTDEFVFFPVIYWPVLPNAEPLPDAVLAKLDAYMKQGGLVIFDTKTDDGLAATARDPARPTPLARLLGKLDIPPLTPISENHVLTRSFYLLQSFPGRFDNGELWVEASSESSNEAGPLRAVKSDGVSSIIVTSNDFAGAWARDELERPMFAVVPGGEEQRELSYRTGVNIIMYALTGNYKSDQVHVPFILERLGH